MSSSAPTATDNVNGARVLLAWLFLIVLVAALDRSRFGHVLLSYALISIILTTVLRSASTVQWLAAPFAAVASSPATSVQP